MDAAKLIFESMSPSQKADLLKEYDAYNNPENYKKKKPIIGIVMKPEKKGPNDIWQNEYINDEIRAMVYKSGGVPIAIMPTIFHIKFNFFKTIFIFYL